MVNHINCPCSIAMLVYWRVPPHYRNHSSEDIRRLGRSKYAVPNMCRKVRLRSPPYPKNFGPTSMGKWINCHHFVTMVPFCLGQNVRPRGPEEKKIKKGHPCWNPQELAWSNCYHPFAQSSRVGEDFFLSSSWWWFQQKDESILKIIEDIKFFKLKLHKTSDFNREVMRSHQLVISPWIKATRKPSFLRLHFGISPWFQPCDFCHRWGTFSKAMVSLCEMTLASWPTPSRVLTECPGNAKLRKWRADRGLLRSIEIH
jgi:hypothetical protein